MATPCALFQRAYASGSQAGHIGVGVFLSHRPHGHRAAFSCSQAIYRPSLAARGVAVEAREMSHSAKATGVRRRCCAEQTLMPGGTVAPMPGRFVRPPEHQWVGTAFGNGGTTSVRNFATPTR